MKLEPAEKQNAKNLTAFLKKGKYLEKEKLLINLSDLMLRFTVTELKACFVNPFQKRIISFLRIHFHQLTFLYYVSVKHNATKAMLIYLALSET